jgi:hypothetical protein
MTLFHLRAALFVTQGLLPQKGGPLPETGPVRRPLPNWLLFAEDRFRGSMRRGVQPDLERVLGWFAVEFVFLTVRGHALAADPFVHTASSARLRRRLMVSPGMYSASPGESD